MKIYVICALVAGGVFLAGLVQMGAMRTALGTVDSSTLKNEKITVPKAKFPEELVPAAQAKAVEKAAVFTPGPNLHKMVLMSPTGELHSWNEKIPDDWQAESVEETELVVVISKQKKIFIEKILYPNNAPPIDRYLFEVEVSVVEAKTGNILDNRVFRNVPREVRSRESWETTIIGHYVEWNTVYQWVAARSRAGFPNETDPQPVVVVVE